MRNIVPLLHVTEGCSFELYEQALAGYYVSFIITTAIESYTITHECPWFETVMLISFKTLLSFIVLLLAKLALLSFMYSNFFWTMYIVFWPEENDIWFCRSPLENPDFQKKVR